uniref:NADH:ubiquinone reductase (H(+)-translocating) n=1 Tax=Histiostoma blomquisti TaxID=1902798 RepID=A0A342Y129_9ACAR|nr:NADH dehydrogenase subunit 5 [Histiostoma blomquisti]AOR08481.1 NADH dehydrogenase subunit 5 [Histiostoma blomquisti]
MFSLFMMGAYSFILEFMLVESIHIDFSFIFMFDYISLFFFSFVSLISSLVFLYSKFYMSDISYFFNVDGLRFFYLLFLFVASMFFLVFAGSWVIVLFGWDGLGLISFLLVIYYNDSSSLGSGLLTVFTNRIGDSFFILSFMFMFFNGFILYDYMGFYSSLFVLFFISMGCITKSAQIPFSSWLPAAMAAPTPVSSLVHSSTLVTAGIYLFIRFNYLFYSIFFLLSIVSLFTMLMGGVCAVYEKDFKKVVAMSTLSQLGFMVFSVSSGVWVIAFLHMMFHAFFKSSLFLATGSLMVSVMGGQDLRYFGSFGILFFSKLFFISSCVSLVGFPFSLGFYSKDLVISCIFSWSSGFFFFIFVLSCFLTVCYSVRLISSSFFLFPSFSSSSSTAESLFFIFPVVVLFMISIFFGDFFFSFFSVPVMISFLECFLGVLIILGGVFIYFYMPSFFFVSSFVSNTFFLSLFSIPVLSSLYVDFSFFPDYTWFEILGGGGVLSFLSFSFHKGIFLFSLVFSFSLLFLFIISL